MLHVNMLKPLCGMLEASLSYCKQFAPGAESIGHAVSPCNPRVANKSINNAQYVLAWHADDVKSACADPKANDKFAAWVEEKCGSEALGHVTTTRGKRHDCLGMTLDLTKRKALKADITERISQLEKDSLDTLRKEIEPRGDKLFKADDNRNYLCKEKSETFYSFAMKIVLLRKRGCPDVKVRVSFLAVRAGKSTDQDHNKLIRLISLTVAVVGNILCMESNNSCALAWYADVIPFARHQQMQLCVALMLVSKALSFNYELLKITT